MSATCKPRTGTSDPRLWRAAPRLVLFVGGRRTRAATFSTFQLRHAIPSRSTAPGAATQVVVVDGAEVAQ